MEIVEYIDEQGKGAGQYAKRHQVGLRDVPREVEVLNPETQEKAKVTLIEKEPVFQDEVIPTRRFVVCDADGNIKAVHEIRFSVAMEIEGKPHPFELQPGEECYEIDSTSFQQTDTEAGSEPTDILNFILRSKKVGTKNANGKYNLNPKS